MASRDKSVKIAFELPSSKLYVNEDGHVNPEQEFDEQAEIAQMEQNILRLQTIHQRLDSIIQELEEFLKKN